MHLRHLNQYLFNLVGAQKFTNGYKSWHRSTYIQEMILIISFIHSFIQPLIQAPPSNRETHMNRHNTRTDRPRTELAVIKLRKMQHSKTEDFHDAIKENIIVLLTFRFGSLIGHRTTAHADEELIQRLTLQRHLVIVAPIKSSSVRTAGWMSERSI